MDKGSERSSNGLVAARIRLLPHLSQPTSGISRIGLPPPCILFLARNRMHGGGRPMREIPEVGCERCGSNLIRAATKPLDDRSDPLSMNHCDNCGHYSSFKFSFYWPVNLQIYVQAK